MIRKMCKGITSHDAGFCVEFKRSVYLAGKATIKKAIMFTKNLM